MKNTKALMILCLILFTIGCSDYMEFAEKEYQAERDAMKEEGFLFFPGEDEMQDVDPYKDNPIINEGIKSNQENEQGYSPMEEKEYPEIIKQDLEKSTKESEIPEERRDSYWKRLLEFRSE